MMEVDITNIVDGLRYLASYEFQKIAWFENDKGLWSSFDQDVEEIFDTTNLDLAFENNEIVFGKKADASLIELEQACNALGYDWTGREKELLESDELAAIRAMAKRCLRLIKERDPQESTVDLVEVDLPPLGITFSDMDEE